MHSSISKILIENPVQKTHVLIVTQPWFYNHEKNNPYEDKLHGYLVYYCSPLFTHEIFCKTYILIITFIQYNNVVYNDNKQWTIYQDNELNWTLYKKIKYI